MVKVGIVTIVDYTNFGNRLQNYATYYVLTQKFECEAITLATHREKSFCNGNYILWLKEKFAQMLCSIAPELAERKFGSNISRWSNFCKWSKRIPTKNYYGTDNFPKSVNDQFDLFFAGSDQIWNYRFEFINLYNFFLKFADKNKRVALSGSFGVDIIPEELKHKYIEGLKDFEFLSVREEAGQRLVKKLIDRDIPVLIDPVMMLSKKEWLAVSKKPRVDCSKPYVLKYYLGDESEEEKIDIWAKNNNFEIYELLNNQILELYSAGPGEFITLLHNATLICSDSFHCIAFAIIFSKPFVVYDRKGKDTGMSSRLDTLLNKFGFQNRWYHLLDENEYLSCNYEHCAEKIHAEQNRFSDYISEIIKKGGK